MGAKTVVDDLGNVAASKDSAFRVQTWTEELGATYTWRAVSNDKARGGSYLVERRPGASARWSFSGSSLTWVTMTGPAHGKAEVYVDGTLRGTYSNYSERVRFGVERSFTGLGAGQHTVEVRALGKKGARAGTGTLVAVDGFVTGERQRRHTGRHAVMAAHDEQRRRPTATTRSPTSPVRQQPSTSAAPR